MRNLITFIVLLTALSAAAFGQSPDSSRNIAYLTPSDAAAMQNAARSGTASKPEPRPADVYRIGVNDLVRIELVDVPGVPKTLRVRTDGTIDFPLAGGDIDVAGKTIAEVESLLTGAVKLVNAPKIKLKVCEFISHTVSVWGLVNQPGEHQIQRDAVPFYVLRAMAGVDPRAVRVRITHASTAATDELLLTDAALDTLFIFPGDSIEFLEKSGG